jgi:hypothetical protein
MATTSTCRVWLRGAWSPLSRSGDIVVNGAQASNYVKRASRRRRCRHLILPHGNGGRGRSSPGEDMGTAPTPARSAHLGMVLLLLSASFGGVRNPAVAPSVLPRNRTTTPLAFRRGCSSGIVAEGAVLVSCGTVAAAAAIAPISGCRFTADGGSCGHFGRAACGTSVAVVAASGRRYGPVPLLISSWHSWGCCRSDAATVSISGGTRRRRR